MDAIEVEVIADQLFASFEEHDYDRSRSMFAPDARAWSNLRNVESDVDGLLANLPVMLQSIGPHRYTEVRRVIGVDGFVEQHRVVATRPDGTELELGDVCVVVRLDRSGLVTRLDEYLDTHGLRRALKG
jgi:hypothetical protein